MQAIPREETLLASQLTKRQINSLNFPKNKTYPWSPDEEGQKYGRVEEGDETAALEYLANLSPE
ncbi:hypothetical protein ACEE90_03425 [Corynebacterium phoceense]